MIKEFVDRFDNSREKLKEIFKAGVPDSYEDLFKATISAMFEDQDDYDVPDINRITMIDHGDYQGTLLFVVAATGYQPSVFWTCCVGYGSCSGCDTLQRIEADNYDWEKKGATDDQVSDLMNLALGIVQNMKRIGYYETEQQ